MAGNNHEGLGDEFFEQILTGPPGSYPPMALQLSSGGGVGGSGIGGMLPLGLNLEQSVGSGFRDDIGGNSLLNVTLLLLHHLSSPIYIFHGCLPKVMADGEWPCPHHGRRFISNVRSAAASAT